MKQVAMTPVTFGNRSNGLAAYKAWTESLENDDNFPDDQNILANRYFTHDNLVGFLAEARWYASLFLSGITESGDQFIHRNSIEPLLHAAALYAGEHRLMWELWDIAGGIGNPEGWKVFLSGEKRNKMKIIIEKALQKDRLAIEHINEAIKTMEG